MRVTTRHLSRLAVAVAATACGTPVHAVSTGDSVADAAPPVSAALVPESARIPVVDDYFGTRIADDYRWLEDPKDPRVVAWTHAQNEHTKRRLHGIPARAKIRQRLADLAGGQATTYSHVTPYASGSLALKLAPTMQQPIIVRRADREGSGEEHTLFDSNAFDPSGKTSIDWFVPSPDGKLLAISLSREGTESGDVHLFDIAAKRMRPEVTTRAHGGTAGGSLAWNRDSTGYWYTRYPHEGERASADLPFYQQVYFHRVGTDSAKDTYVLGRELPKIAEIKLRASERGDVLAHVQNGDGRAYELFIMPDGKSFRRIASYADKVMGAQFGPDGTLYLLSRKGAPNGKVVRRKAPYDETSETVVVPAGDGVIQEFLVTQSRAFVIEVRGGPSRLVSYSLRTPTESPRVIDVGVRYPGLSHLRGLQGDDVLVERESYLDAPAWLAVRGADNRVKTGPWAEPSAFDMSDAEVTREVCVSADQTRVPMSLIHKKGVVRTSSSPTLLTGYGGFGISRTPKLRATTRLWLDMGGVLVDTNLRGGSEWGESWHTAGRLSNKQNVFDDFYACAKRLFELGVTSPKKLAIFGRSNGGLLMGAALVQHPEAYRAVVSQVGIYDMLRLEKTPNGAFNVTEFGSVKDETMFRALLAYSPYHNVKPNTSYPAVFLSTGANDARVEPYNSRKMAAKLQQSQASSRPILLRVQWDTGHGAGTPTSAMLDELSDIYAFLHAELEMDGP